MSTVNVRRAALTDVPALAVLFQQEAECQQSLAESFTLEPRADWPCYVTDRLHRRNGAILVAEIDRMPVGFADIRLIQRGHVPAQRRFPLFRKAPEPVVRSRLAGCIDDLYVEPRLRRQGIATQLVEGAFRWFAERDVRQVEGAIWTGNALSQEFFRNLGFRVSRILMTRDI